MDAAAQTGEGEAWGRARASRAGGESAPVIIEELRALSRPQRSAFIASLLGWSLDAFDFFTLVFVVSDIAKAFDAKVSTVSLAIALTLMARPVGAFLFGWLADKYGRRPVLMINVSLFAGLAFLSGFAPSLEALLVIRLLFGIAMGGEWGVGSSLAMESIPAKSRGVVSGFLQSGYPMGYLIASVAYLFIDQIGWRGMLMLGAAPALLVMYIRREVKESPAFEAVRAEAAAAAASRPPPSALASGERGAASGVHIASLVSGLLLLAVALMTGSTAGSIPTLLTALLGLSLVLGAGVATLRRRAAGPALAAHYADHLRTFWIALATALVAAWVVWSVSGTLGQLGVTTTDVARVGAALLGLWFLVRGALALRPAQAGLGLRPTQAASFFGSLEKAWPRLIYLALLMTAFNVFSHGTHDLYPTFLKEDLKLKKELVTLLAVMGNVGAVVGGLTFGALSERFGRRRTIAAAALLCLPFIPLWIWGGSVFLLIAGVFMVNVSVQGAWGVVPAHLNELSPAQARSTFPGFTYQLGNLMASGITVLQSTIAENRGGQFGYAQAVTVGGIAVVVAVLAFFGPEAKGSAFAPEEPTPAD